MSQQQCLLQADFTVPSSREAVDADNAWNQMLRARIPDLFLAALESFKHLAAGGARAAEDAPGRAVPAPHVSFWVNRWLECVPLVGEVRVGEGDVLGCPSLGQAPQSCFQACGPQTSLAHSGCCQYGQSLPSQAACA